MITPKAECESLLNALLPFAEQMLEKLGEFFPYGATLHGNGEMEIVQGYEGESDVFPPK